jgi:hypothetical protein
MAALLLVFLSVVRPVRLSLTVVMEEAAIPAARYMRPMNSGLFCGKECAEDSLFQGKD